MELLLELFEWFRGTRGRSSSMVVACDGTGLGTVFFYTVADGLEVTLSWYIASRATVYFMLILPGTLAV